MTSSSRTLPLAVFENSGYSPNSIYILHISGIPRMRSADTRRLLGIVSQSARREILIAQGSLLYVSPKRRGLAKPSEVDPCIKMTRQRRSGIRVGDEDCEKNGLRGERDEVREVKILSGSAIEKERTSIGIENTTETGSVKSELKSKTVSGLFINDSKTNK
ncbi:hypothetical protein EVAR_46902_1 [Eumeta japonica]|uniref:Uncharacterized protein n=1 Tax=Eumeta variegata TaxID=151549 RepID=A0A4C1YG46_EUMVA|nr:hypothetical protein EVAR_46902_1 [Eumeta japonica]